MDQALVVVLALLWAVVLLPGALKTHRRSVRASVGGFERTMDILRQRPQGRNVLVPADTERIGRSETLVEQRVLVREDNPALLRQRAILFALVFSVALTLLLGMAFGGIAWVLLLASLVAVAIDVTMLRLRKIQRDRAREVVRELADLRAARRAVRHRSTGAAAVGAEDGPATYYFEA